MNLIWFRNDLRIHDHVALWHASQAGSCIAIVFFSPQQWTRHDDAAIKIDFYLRQLHDLQQSLQQLNIPLQVHVVQNWQDIAPVLLNTMQEFNIDAAFANMEIGVNEVQRDHLVQNTLQQHSKVLHLYQDRTLFPLHSILNKSGQPYQVFGAFKRVCYERLQISLPRCYPAPDKQAPLAIQDSEIPAYESLYQSKINPAQQQLWPIGEVYAQQQLQQFISERVTDYKALRDYPAITATSQLAAYLNIGILSVRQCLEGLFAAQQHTFMPDNEGQQTWLDELLWREFYQHILYEFPQVSKHQPFKLATQQIIWRDDLQDLQAWQQGKTGIPIVDAGMRQLLATGWMHNRVRMIVAMFLSKNLLIDWRKGEQWFMQHLIDGDLAANNGGWQWCASTGTDAVPYFRVFNPVTQSQKFDAEGHYIRQWVPELAKLPAPMIHEPYAFSNCPTIDYPQPIVDLKASRLRAIEAFQRINQENHPAQ